MERPVEALDGDALAHPATPTETAALQMALGAQRTALTEEATNAERIAIVEKLATVGLEAHNRDRGRGTIAIAALEEASATFWAAKAWRQLAGTDAIHAQSLLLRGRTEEAIERWREASEVATRVPDAAFTAPLQLPAGEFFLDTGRLTDARAALNAAQAGFAAQNDAKGIAHCQRFRGGVALEEGDLMTARRELQTSLTALTRLDDNDTAAIRGTLGDVALREGNLDAADKLYRDGLAHWQKRNQTFWTAHFLSRRAEVALRHREFDAAETQATESLRLLDASNGPITRIYPLTVFGDLARARGDRETAARRHAEALALWKRLVNPRRIHAAEAALQADRQPTD